MRLPLSKGKGDRNEIIVEFLKNIKERTRLNDREDYSAYVRTKEKFLRNIEHLLYYLFTKK